MDDKNTTFNKVIALVDMINELDCLGAEDLKSLIFIGAVKVEGEVGLTAKMVVAGNMLNIAASLNELAIKEPTFKNAMKVAVGLIVSNEDPMKGFIASELLGVSKIADDYGPCDCPECLAKRKEKIKSNPNIN